MIMHIRLASRLMFRTPHWFGLLLRRCSWRCRSLARARCLPLSITDHSFVVYTEVGITTGYGLDDRGVAVRVPVS
jgi:hypothetical protein